VKNLIIIIILIAIPVFALANSFFENHQPNSSQYPQMNNERAYRIMQKTIQNWNYATVAWTNMYDYDYYYVSNTSDNPDSVGAYVWMPDSGTFHLTGVYHITYDASGEHVTHIVLSLSSGTVVDIYLDITFNYSPQGYLTGYLMQEPGNNGLEPVASMTIQYVSTNNFQLWNWELRNDDWVPQWNHTTFQWDAQGRITEEITEISLDSLAWVNDEQFIHEYLAGDTTTGDIFVNNFSHQLPLSMISENNGPFFGKQAQTFTKFWNNGYWINKYKEVFAYEGNDILTNVTEYKWQGGNWVNNAKNDYLYNANNNMTEDIYSIWTSNAWKNDTRYLYDWTNYTANSDDVITPAVQNISAYPNPFRQASTVTFEAKLTPAETGSLVIYNLKGQIVKAFDIGSAAPKLNWDSRDNNDRLCGAGIYFYRLTTNKHQETKKLIILK
jgi:hypothetical protein